MRIALIGDPIAHSKSCHVYTYIFQKLGYPLHFQLIRTTKKALPSKIAFLRTFDAFLVTTPLKQLILPFMHNVSPTAQIANAVNFVRSDGQNLSGYNTDGFGALECIEKHMSVYQKKILVLGAGGAASSICFEAKKRLAQVHVHNKTAVRAQILAKRLNLTVEETLQAPYDIIIQATSAGLTKKSINPFVNGALFEKSKLALEINYASGQTQFVNLARQLCPCLILADQMYYFMVKQQIQILLNITLDDEQFFKKILHFFEI